jgi:hypothetical protein
LGQDTFEVDPTLWLWGMGLLLAAAFLFGRKAEPKAGKRKRESVQRKIQKLRTQLKQLESET